jgi:hypothetical protein
MTAEEIEYVVASIMGWIQWQINEKGDSFVCESVCEKYSKIS